MASSTFRTSSTGAIDSTRILTFDNFRLVALRLPALLPERVRQLMLGALLEVLTEGQGRSTKQLTVEDATVWQRQGASSVWVRGADINPWSLT